MASGKAEARRADGRARHEGKRASGSPSISTGRGRSRSRPASASSITCWSSFRRHSLIDMTVEAKGDLHIDDHHTVEDTGIALGQAIAKALGERRGITRYASLDLAMDETLTRAAVDVSGRPFLVWQVAFPSAKIGTLRHRARARVLPGVRPECRHHAACDQPLRCQQPSHRRDLLQGGGARASRGDRIRSAPGGCDPVDQGHAEGIGRWQAMSSCGPPAKAMRKRTRVFVPRRLLRSGPSSCRLLWFLWYRLWIEDDPRARGRVLLAVLGESLARGDSPIVALWLLVSCLPGSRATTADREAAPQGLRAKPRWSSASHRAEAEDALVRPGETIVPGPNGRSPAIGAAPPVSGPAPADPGRGMIGLVGHRGGA